MSRTAIIYTAEDCFRCKHVKTVFQTAGVEFEERSALQWLMGDLWTMRWEEERIVEVRAMLAFHNEQLPVVDCRGDDSLKQRLTDLWLANPIPRCRDDQCQLRSRSSCEGGL